MTDDPDRVAMERVARAFASLPRRHREVIRLACIEKLTPPEWGIRLGLDEAQAERRLALAIAALDRAVERQERPWWHVW